MEEGLVPVCSDLGQSAEHTLLHWLGRRSNRRGVLSMGYDRIVRSSAVRPFDPTLRHLLDGGYVEKLDYDGNILSVKVLVICPGPEEVSQNGAPGARGTILVPQALEEARSPEGLGGTEGTGETRRAAVNSVVHLCHPSAQKRVRPQRPNVRLAVEFPQFLREHGMGLFPQHDWQGMARGLRVWHDKYEVSYDLVPILMQEFVKHPEWCSRSKRSPWQIFLSRRDQLVGLVVSQRQQDPGRRSFGAQSWNERPTLSPA